MSSTQGPVAPFPIIVIVGPTAVGKTAVSLRLAQELRGEIINLDSIQIYKGLDIGSAKPSREERSLVPHHLIDIREPDEVMDVASFTRLATMAITRVRARSRVPILVGGTGFYLKGLLGQLNEMVGHVPAIREFLKGQLAQKGHDYLYSWLKEVDPVTASRISPADSYRVIRALEVYLATGRPMSEQFRSRGRLGGPSSETQWVFKFCLMVNRQELYDRIEARVDEMIEQGFVKEVKELLERGFSPHLKPLQSIGYRHIISYLQGNMDLTRAIEEMKRDTRRYAKRQITWFKKEPGLRWFNPFKLLNSPNIWKAIN